MEIGLNQPLIYMCPFPPVSPQFFSFPLLQLGSKKKLFLGTKNMEGAFAPPPKLWL